MDTVTHKSEIEQFHELAKLVEKVDHPVEISAEVIMVLDDEISALEYMLKWTQNELLSTQSQ